MDNQQANVVESYYGYIHQCVCVSSSPALLRLSRKYASFAATNHTTLSLPNSVLLAHDA